MYIARAACEPVPFTTGNTNWTTLTPQIDRKQRYFAIDNLHFTHWERPDDPLTDTILDGELVIDIDSNGVETLRYYAFDCLVLGGENIMRKPLDKRYAVSCTLSQKLTGSGYASGS